MEFIKDIFTISNQSRGFVNKIETDYLYRYLLGTFTELYKINETRLLVSGRSPESSDYLLRSMEH